MTNRPPRQDGECVGLRMVAVAVDDEYRIVIPMDECPSRRERTSVGTPLPSPRAKRAYIEGRVVGFEGPGSTTRSMKAATEVSKVGSRHRREGKVAI